jgi:hypothetical protein
LSKQIFKEYLAEDEKEDNLQERENMRIIYNGNNSHFMQTFRALKELTSYTRLISWSPFFTARLFRRRRYIRDSAVTLRF